VADLLQILDPIASQITLIDGNTEKVALPSNKISTRDIGIRLHYLNEITPTLYSGSLFILKCVAAQLLTSIELIRTRKDTDVVLFYMAYPQFLLPLLVATFMKKKTIEVVARGRFDSFRAKIARLQDPLLFTLLSGISPETEAISKEFNLQKYGHKVLPTGSRFIDTVKYAINTELDERDNIVGYLGRLRPEKGIMNLVTAALAMHDEGSGIEFAIAGDGALREEIDKKTELDKRITNCGWLPKQLVPNYLNSLKLLILPTELEGLPTVLLEAMACGTPVLTTAVGGVLDLVRDEDTGFILADNSPQSIRASIVRVLGHPHLETISAKARRVVEQQYSYAAAVTRYRRILSLEVGCE
jgi:glycosyltransferase involved in cell wall biosynthesis